MVTSRDGTRIACWRGGRGGPPLVLVHGTAVDHNYFWPAIDVLVREYEVYAVERRGRGASGDPPDYAIEREFEDVAAVVDAVGEPVNLLGHSFGGVCSLEAIRLTKNVRSLILYEPSLFFPKAPNPLILKLQDLIDRGEKERALETYVLEAVRPTPERLARQRASAAWADRVASVHTIAREWTALQAYRFVPEQFREMRIPTLLLVGAESVPWTNGNAQLLHDALPGSQMVILAGQGHRAGSAPGPGTEVFTRAVLSFLKNGSGVG